MVLACTVRGCAAGLVRRERAYVCSHGHAFDIARSGYLNLMQPHDRHSRSPGDSPEAVRARRALLDAGFGEVLSQALEESVAHAALRPRACVADLGCGEGTYLDRLARCFDLDAFGVDLSAAAIEAAARRHKGPLWIVANADRTLPFEDGVLDLVLSIDGRRNPSESARVLAPGGALVVAVPAEDDMAELREAVLGQAQSVDRAVAVEAEMSGRFELVERTLARDRRELDATGLADLGVATYRWGRTREKEKLASIDRLAVTTSHHVLRFRRA